MKVAKRIVSLISKIINSILLRIWLKKNSTSGNVHLAIKHATLQKIPFHKDQVYLRRTLSDITIIHEYIFGNYFKKSYLDDRLKALVPTVLIDIGANIGLSSLSLVKYFKGIKKVIAIEAEEKNYGLLKANFELWQKKYLGIEWIAMHAVATSSENQKFYQDKSLNDLTGEHSVSATFRYSPLRGINNTKESQNTVSINKLFNDIDDSQKVIVKIDIEGGEEHLFKCNNEWIRRCLFITAEVHDSYHPVMLNSSTKMIKEIVENDFAICPDNNIIHFYNRKMYCSND